MTENWYVEADADRDRRVPLWPGRAGAVPPDGARTGARAGARFGGSAARGAGPGALTAEGASAGGAGAVVGGAFAGHCAGRAAGGAGGVRPWARRLAAGAAAVVLSLGGAAVVGAAALRWETETVAVAGLVPGTVAPATEAARFDAASVVVARIRVD